MSKGTLLIPPVQISVWCITILLIKCFFSQGEMVNRIEDNIINSSNYVEKAVDNTSAAVVSQKKARKVCNLNQH